MSHIANESSAQNTNFFYFEFQSLEIGRLDLLDLLTWPEKDVDDVLTSALDDRSHLKN